MSLFNIDCEVNLFVWAFDVEVIDFYVAFSQIVITN